jgi:hypothetical protein
MSAGKEKHGKMPLSLSLFKSNEGGINTSKLPSGKPERIPVPGSNSIFQLFNRRRIS